MADVKCPADVKWLVRMLQILPPGLRGKLEPLADCPEVVAVLEKSRQKSEKQEGK